jgi:hypothetical protein
MSQTCLQILRAIQSIGESGLCRLSLGVTPTAQIHHVFHVSQLKPFTPDYTPVFTTLPHYQDLAQHDVVPKEILDRRLVKKGGRAVPQVLILSHLSPDSTTWEDYYVLQERFPHSLA